MRAFSGYNGLTTAQQLVHLRNSKAFDGEGELKRDKLTWHFTAQPTPISRCYQIEIVLERFDTPDVFVREPDISILASGRDIPHVYHDPLKLCLFHPKKNQWHNGLRLDETIIPWTTLWLYYFEEWLVTDKWKGGGIHPDSNLQIEGNRQTRRMSASVNSGGSF